MLLLSPPWVFRSAAVTIVEVVPPYEPGLLVVEELRVTAGGGERKNKCHFGFSF